MNIESDIYIFIIFIQLLFIVYFMKKASGKKKVQSELFLNQDSYKKLIDIVPNGIFIHDGEKILFTNQSGAKLLGGQKPEDFIGKRVLDVVHPDYFDIVKERIQSIKSGYKNSLEFVEEKFIRLDGTVIDVEVSTIGFNNNGKKVILGIIRDISERKKVLALQKTVENERMLLAEAEEYERLRSEFFANLSHEFKTPLNLIFSSLQLLEIKLSNKIDVLYDRGIRNNLRILKQNYYRLLRMVNNLIDITKIDSNYYDLQLENCNIVNLIENISILVAQYIEKKDIKLVFDTEIEEKIISCDPDKIERIILNLLSNCVKFTKSGGCISVNIKDKNDRVLISVKDTGIGIPKEKIDIIFDKFRQVDKSMRREHEGSGIGLSLVKALVEMHGGIIKVESEFGKGTEFIIELPAKIIEGKKYEEDIDKHYLMEKINIEFSDVYM